MTLDSAIHKATTFYDLIGQKVKHAKKGKIKVVSRITAFKKDTGVWDVAVFLKVNKRVFIHLSQIAL